MYADLILKTIDICCVNTVSFVLYSVNALSFVRKKQRTGMVLLAKVAYGQILSEQAKVRYP